MRIAVVVPNETPNARYRAFIPMAALAQRGHQIGTAVVPHQSNLPPVDIFREYDVVFIWRLYHQPLRRMVRLLQNDGVAVVWDNDDDLAAVPRGSLAYREVGGVHGHRAQMGADAMVRAVDAVTTPSRVLADRFRTAGQPHVHVIENRLPDVYARKRHLGRSVVVGWVAGGEHQTDLGPLGLRDVFRRLLERHCGLEFISVGIPLELRSDRYRRVEVVPYDQLSDQIAQFDIGLAPLADTSFNRARSNVKLKEYGSCGVPWLASSIGPYVGLGEREGGRLVGSDDWFGAIDSLVRDARARKRLGRRAYAWAKSQIASRHALEWERVLDAAHRRRAQM